MLRVVTLPPQLSAPAALAFAGDARRAGAGALELRSDLHADTEPVEALARVIPLLVAQRGPKLPARWLEAARWVDRALPAATDQRTLLSHHAAAPMTPDAAVALWAGTPHREAAGIKHVEPLGALRTADRLLETQRRLLGLVGPGKVTVLAVGACALPFRAVLAEANALDYLAGSAQWAAVPGQRLLADAVRGDARPLGVGGDRERLGILGARIAWARSPRVHGQPFDRIELPPETPLGAVLDALWPHYRGLAVTSPFKGPAARAVGAPINAVNTLVRRAGGWHGLNTDVEGARALLEALDAHEVTALGGGGATRALQLAAAALGIRLTVVHRAQPPGAIAGAAVWTWPSHVPPPRSLSLAGARVAVIAYGPPGHAVAAQVRALGGEPLRLGPRWFVAQARAQRAVWEAA